MGQALERSAARLGCSERTLRRYISGGLLHGHRLDRFRFELPASEERYARDHWDLLHGLRAVLRTEREVRLAVVFGSMATGEDAVESDVDLLVVHRGAQRSALARLNRRLEDACRREVQLVQLSEARNAPGLLADALSEGRVIVDRDGLWAELRAERPSVLEAAEREYEASLANAQVSVEAARRRLEMRT